MNRVPLPRLTFPLALMALNLTGCDSGAAGIGRNEGAGPLAVPMDSVLLMTDDTLYIGKPFNLTVDPHDGTFYVTDLFSRRMYRFGRNGETLNTYGRPGQGPGELSSPGLGFVLDDTTVAVLDVNTSLINLYDKTTEDFIRAKRNAAITPWTVPIVRNDTVWLGGLIMSDLTGAVAWDLESDSMTYFGPVPVEYHRSAEGVGQYMGFWPYPVLTGRADTLISGMSGSDYLFVLDHAGQVIEALRIPFARRRGVPEGVVDKFESPSLTAKKAFGATSALVSLHHLPDARLALAHIDQLLEGDDPRMAQVSAKLFITLIATDRRSACVDGVVPVRGDLTPQVAFRADTLFVLDHRIIEDRLDSWIVRFQIVENTCDWAPVPSLTQ